MSSLPPCKVCGKVLLTVTSHHKNHNKHHNKMNDMSAFPCKICGKIYPTKSSRKHHTKKHKIGEELLDRQLGKVKEADMVEMGKEEQLEAPTAELTTAVPILANDRAPPSRPPTPSFVQLHETSKSDADYVTL